MYLEYIITHSIDEVQVQLYESNIIYLIIACQTFN